MENFQDKFRQLKRAYKSAILYREILDSTTATILKFGDEKIEKFYSLSKYDKDGFNYNTPYDFELIIKSFIDSVENCNMKANESTIAMIDTMITAVERSVVTPVTNMMRRVFNKEVNGEFDGLFMYPDMSKIFIKSGLFEKLGIKPPKDIDNFHIKDKLEFKD